MLQRLRVKKITLDGVHDQTDLESLFERASCHFRGAPIYREHRGGQKADGSCELE
jgi:hypothetical protein